MQAFLHKIEKVVSRDIVLSIVKFLNDDDKRHVITKWGKKEWANWFPKAIEEKENSHEYTHKVHGELHSLNGRPSVVSRNKLQKNDWLGHITYELEWHQNGLLHREGDLPAKKLITFSRNHGQIIQLIEYHYQYGYEFRVCGNHVITFSIDTSIRLMLYSKATSIHYYQTESKGPIKIIENNLQTQKSKHVDDKVRYSYNRFPIWMKKLVAPLLSPEWLVT
ncbi:MAG: hypothetical protein Edafosvirus5_48 [Edafosvirus sp.]|uniref:Uncharacterized protein n=1 Tax=Edafosvirus sp. TaxID=2487765 RepID=A0A3G4ZTA7_9VIRU|nr:MAG: hypothetical protein Edafosvirus5_48 [Edafosvirus sp.]